MRKKDQERYDTIENPLSIRQNQTEHRRQNSSVNKAADECSETRTPTLRNSQLGGGGLRVGHGKRETVQPGSQGGGEASREGLKDRLSLMMNDM